MVSVFEESFSKQRRRSIFLVVGTITAVLVVLYFVNGLNSSSSGLQQNPGTQANQAVPPVESTTSVAVEQPPELWLQASGASSGNAAWPPAVVAPFSTVWSITTGREVFSPPAIVGDMIYIAGNDKVLRGLNRNTGSQLWSRSVTCGLSGGVAADSSAVYFSGQDGYMYALDRETGSENWKAGLGYHIFTDACVFCDSLVLAGNSMGSIAALGKETGELIWSDTMNGLLLGPALSESTAVFSSEAGAVGAWNITGSVLWSRGFSSQPSAPSIESGVVFLGFSSGKVLALSLQTGETLWEAALDEVRGRTVVSRPAVYNDSLLVAGTCDGRVFCLETAGGGLVWETQFDNWVSTTPAVCDTIVYASCDDGRIHLLSLNTGLPIGEIETGSYSGTPPILAGGILYFGSSGGEFTAASGTVPVSADSSEEE
jgi:outer membrane protein assembly factor BamB